MKPIPLTQHIRQMNIVRVKLDLNSHFLDTGIGDQGDIVLCRMLKGPKEGTTWDTQSVILQTDDLFLGVLGNRESTTHVVGGLPEGGIRIEEKTPLDWLGGNSGIVGKLYHSPRAHNDHGAQWSHQVSVLGLVVGSHGTPINIKQLARKPQAKELRTPTIMVAGTSAEAGKTTFCKKLISALTLKGLRVGAVKITGSGGFMDSLEYRTAGASVTFDMVDAGLSSTYNNEELFQELGINPLLFCQDSGAQVIIAETGGDFIWANNLSLLTNRHLKKALLSYPIFCNDALAAIGAVKVLDSIDCILDKPYHLVASPFRNLLGFRNRMQRFLANEATIFDPNDVQPFVNMVLGAIT